MATTVCSKCTDLWNWYAMYSNGIRQVECLGEYHNVYADIELSKVVTIGWEPSKTNMDGISMDMPSLEFVPVFFRRRLRGVNLDDNEISELPTIHGLGWETKEQDGRTSGTYTFLLADGSIITSSDRNSI